MQGYKITVQGFKITEMGKDNIPVVIEKDGEDVRTRKVGLFKKVEVDRYKADNIASVNFYNESEIKNNVISRGIVGGLLLGPLGAIIGGMSGINRTKNKLFMLIKLNDGGEAVYELSGKYQIDKLRKIFLQKM